MLLVTQTRLVRHPDRRQALPLAPLHSIALNHLYLAKYKVGPVAQIKLIMPSFSNLLVVTHYEFFIKRVRM